MVNDRLGGVEAAKIVMYSLNFAEIKALTMADDWAGIAALVCNAASVLEKAGADCLLIGANTMHKIAEQVQASVNIPVIHIAKVTGDAINEQNLHAVALLGTKYVMQQDFYKDQLAVKGITAIIPGQEDIDYINNAIYSEFGKGIFLPETKKRMLEIINSLSIQGAEGVIFGCTEIPLLIQQSDCNIPVFDTTQIHAAAAVKFALQ